MIFAMYMAGFAAYLLLAILVAWIVSLFASKAKRSKVMGVVFAGLIALPVGDAALSYLYFHFLCAKQGGVKIYEQVEGVEGYLIYDLDSIWDRDLIESPYNFIETEKSGVYRRFTRSGGKVVTEILEKPQSLYAIGKITREKLRFFNIGKAKLEIFETDTDKILARQTSFNGGWTTFRPWPGQGLSCGHKDDLVTSTLIPRQTNFGTR